MIFHLKAFAKNAGRKSCKENGGKIDGSKQICRNTDREEFAGGICRGITGKK